jgi:hypothetical protein
MKQRIVIVPKNDTAEKALNFDNAPEEQLLKLYLNEEEFNSLYKHGIFKLINHIAETNIDDYENDSVTRGEKVKNVIDALSMQKSSLDEHLVLLAVEKILVLFKDAFQKGTGVYFYF